MLAGLAATIVIAGAEPASSQILTGEVHVNSQNVFNDNFQGLNSTAATPANTTRDDFITTDSVGASGTAELGLQRLFARGEVGHGFHAKSTVFDSDLLTLSGGVNWKVTSACSGDATVLLDQHQSATEELTVPVPNQAQTVTYGAGGLCNVGSGYWTGLDARRAELTNSSALQRTTNRTETTIKSHFFYQLPTVTKLGGDLGYIERVYPNLSNQTVDEYDVSAIFERQIGQKTYLASAIGIAAVTAYGTTTAAGVTSSTATSVNPTFNINVSYAATRSLTATLLVARAEQSNDQVVSSITTVDTAQLGAIWQVSPKISASETAAYTISQFQGGLILGGVNAGTLQQTREDHRFRNTMSVTYDLSRRISLNANYQFTDQDSTLATRTFTSNAITLGVRVTY
jgi:hypothetical protein